MRHPAIPLAVAILAGCATGLVVPVPVDALLAVAWLAWVLSGVCLAHRASRAFVVAALLAAGLCGWTLAVSANSEVTHPKLRATLIRARGPQAVSDTVSDPVLLTGVLTEDALPGEDGFRLVLRTVAVGIDGVTWPSDGTVLLSVTGDAAGARGDRWWRGRLLRVPALLRRPARYLDPGVPDHERALLRRGVALVGTVKSPMLVVVAAKGTWLDEQAAMLRAGARGVIGRDIGRHSSRSAAIVRAIVIGDRTGLDDETEERMQAAGTYHVLAISGGNIAILAGIVVGLLRLFAVRTPAEELIAMAVLVAYAWLVGGGASVSRATLMAVTMLGAHAIDHRSPPLNAIGVSAGLGLALNPLGLVDPGAWLTYGATIAIVLAAGRFGEALVKRPVWTRAVVGLLGASVAAELALFPISAFVFSRVTAAGLIVNFAAIPLMTVVQLGAMVTLVVSTISATAAAFAGYVTHLAAWGLVESGRLVDVAPWLTRRVPAPGVWAMGVYYAGWLVLLAAGMLCRRRAAETLRRTPEAMPLFPNGGDEADLREYRDDRGRGLLDPDRTGTAI